MFKQHLQKKCLICDSCYIIDIHRAAEGTYNFWALELADSRVSSLKSRSRSTADEALLGIYVSHSHPGCSVLQSAKAFRSIRIIQQTGESVRAERRKRCHPSFMKFSLSLWANGEKAISSSSFNRDAVRPTTRWCWDTLIKASGCHDGRGTGRHGRRAKWFPTACCRAIRQSFIWFQGYWIYQSLHVKGRLTPRWTFFYIRASLMRGDG